MCDSTLTVEELEFKSSLPRPPHVGNAKPTCLRILEWLPATDRQTGRELQAWAELNRPGWARVVTCTSKQFLLDQIELLAEQASSSRSVPVLHIEAHGSENGLIGPNIEDGKSQFELLAWEELNPALQRLNTATRCQLILVVVACTGYAAVLALGAGPRAPVLAIVGPESVAIESALLEGSKEFYRRLMDANPKLEALVSNASREAGVNFEWESFVEFAYDAAVDQMIVASRPECRDRWLAKMKKRLVSELGLTESEASERLASNADALDDIEQRIWNQMFSMDLYPENASRFELDLKSIAKGVSAWRKTQGR